MEDGEKHTIFRGKKIILWHKNESLAFNLPHKSIADQLPAPVLQCSATRFYACFSQKYLTVGGWYFVFGGFGLDSGRSILASCYGDLAGICSGLHVEYSGV